MTFQRNSAINLCLSITILVVTACCSRSGHGGDSSLKPLRPFSRAECSECKAKAVSGIPSNVICLERSWESEGERLWLRYYVRDQDLLLVSHKFGKFGPILFGDPGAHIFVVMTYDLEDKVITKGFVQWMAKCISGYLKGIAVDDIFTENEMSFRFISYKGEIIFDYAKADTMKNLTPSRED